MNLIDLEEAVILALQGKLTEYKSLEDVSKINIPKPTSKTNFEGFNTNTTGVFFYDDFLPNSTNREYVLNKQRPGYYEDDDWWHYSDSYITEVTPQEYFDLCYKYIFEKPTIDIKDVIDINSKYYSIDAQRCLDLANKMKSNIKMDLPYIDFRKQAQEGRHRAGAAYLLGIETIPVLILK